MCVQSVLTEIRSGQFGSVLLLLLLVVVMKLETFYLLILFLLEKGVINWNVLFPVK